MPAHLTAIIIAKDEEFHIAECIASVQWVGRVIVFMDPTTSDSTAEIARTCGAEVMSHQFENFAKQRNEALRAADSEWVLVIDADERSSPEQADEIHQVLDNPAHFGYWIPRHNYIFGKLTRHTGWYPDYQMRLLQTAHARYDPAREVHELVLLDGKPGYLNTPFIHYNYLNFAQFRQKQSRYARYDARILYEQGVRPRPHKYVTQPLRHFIWRFVTLQGYRDGFHGLRLSVLMAWYEFQKYVELRRLTRQP